MNLDPAKSYHAFDFWEQKYLGIVKGTMACRALELGCCQIIGLREVQENPQFLASTRHVSMDAVSVKKNLWTDSILDLSLEGAENMEVSYYFYVPEGYTLQEVKADSAECEYCLADSVLRADLKMKSKSVRLSLGFGKRDI